MPKGSLHLDTRPDFVGLGTFRTEHGLLQKLECCFFFPKSEVARIWVLVRGSWPDDGILVTWKFSCEMRVAGNILMAEEIFHSGYMQWDWGNGVENTLVGEITRLKVSCGDVDSSAISRVRFVMTPSALLRSADIVAEQNGEIVVRKVLRKGPVCCMSPGIAFHFASAYRRIAAGKLESNVECELVEPAQMRDPKHILSSLEDVLAVASLAERRVLILTGWNLSYANGATATYYRRDFTVSSQEETDIDETLISLRDIEEFLNKSLHKLRSLPDPGGVKQAVYFALHGQARGIGDSFVMLFAGVETLLNLSQSREDLDPIVPKTQWQPLFDRISSLLNGQETFLALPEGVQAKILNDIRGAN